MHCGSLTLGPRSAKAWCSPTHTASALSSGCAGIRRADATFTGSAASRVLEVNLASGALLAACPQPSTPGTDAPDLYAFRDRIVALGYGLSTQVQQAFAGDWRIEGLPAWLTATPEAGTSDVSTMLSVDRRAAAPSSAVMAALASDVRLNWTATGGAVGSAPLKVGAGFYRLTGQVQNSAASLGLGYQNLAALRLTGLTLVGAPPCG